MKIAEICMVPSLHHKKKSGWNTLCWNTVNQNRGYMTHLLWKGGRGEKKGLHLTKAKKYHTHTTQNSHVQLHSIYGILSRRAKPGNATTV